MSYTPELKTIHRYWISCHILYIKSFLKSPGQEISEYIVFNSSWEFHFAKFRFQTVVLLKKKSESRYVTYYSLLFLPHEIIPKDLSRSSTSLPWVRIFGLRIKAIREKMPPKLFEISSLSISSSTTNAMASLSSVEERTQFLRPLPFASKLQISKTDGVGTTLVPGSVVYKVLQKIFCRDMTKKIKIDICTAYYTTQCKWFRLVAKHRHPDATYMCQVGLKNSI